MGWVKFNFLFSGFGNYFFLDSGRRNCAFNLLTSLSGCKKYVFRNQKSKSKTDKRKNLFFQSYRTCRHAGHFFKSTAADKNTAGRVRGKSHHVLPSSARSAVRLHKPGGAMRAPRATRAQRAHRLAVKHSHCCNNGTYSSTNNNRHFFPHGHGCHFHGGGCE